MKALVPAGGWGTRLRPITYWMPKQLIPIANRPVLEYVLDDIRALGVTRVGLVVGPWEPQIRAVIGDGSRLGLRVSYLRQDRPLGLAHCVRLARPFLGDDDFVMYLGDNVLPAGVAAEGAAFRRDRPAAQVTVSRVPDPRSLGVVELDAGGAVRRLVEKPAHPRSDLAMIGVYFFTAAIHRAVEAIRPSARGELEITDAVQWLVDNGADVRVSRYDGYWKDAGRVGDVLDCNRRLLAGLRARVAGEVDPGSRLTGRVVVEPGARVVRSVLRGPLIVGAGALVQDSRVGPDVALGPGCLVRHSAVTDSIVLAGASVRSAPDLRGSIVGRSATAGPLAAPRRRRTGAEVRVGDER